MDSGLYIVGHPLGSERVTECGLSSTSPRFSSMGHWHPLVFGVNVG
jgi:hypothetical protein